MGFLSRLWNQITGKANDILDAAENPASIARQTIRVIDEKINNAENSLNKAKGRLILIGDDIETCTSEIDKWSAAAIKANSKGEKAFAIECASKVKDFKLKKESFQSEYDSLEETILGLEEDIENAYFERNKATSEITSIETQMHIGAATASAAQAVANINTNDAMSDISRAKESMRVKTAESKAALASAQKKSGSSMDRKLRELDTDSAEDILESLIAQSSQSQLSSTPPKSGSQFHSSFANDSYSSGSSPSSSSCDSSSSSSSSSSSCGD